MGKVVVIAVGFAIFSFIAADLMGPNSVLLNGQDSVVGEIAGEEITLDEYQKYIEEMVYNFTLNQGRNPSSNEMEFLRQQAWEYMIVQTAFAKQFEELGLEVTEEEVVDMVQGKNINPEIKRAFTDPETGEFDRSLILNYLKNISSLPPQQQASWYAFERNLGPGRLRIKYDNLFLNSTYVTMEEAERKHRDQNSIAEIKYLYVPYFSVPDSLIATVTEDDLESYLEEHKDDFKVEESRSMSYVLFPIIPSTEDSTFFIKEVKQLKEEFKEVKSDSIFATANTDSERPYATYRLGELPPELATNSEALREGQIFGPVVDGNSYTLYKISKVFEDTVFSARASHILFKVEDSDDEEAKRKIRDEARKVLNDIKTGADFEEMARLYGSDGTATRGGDLGWFTEGRMVKPFENAVFKAGSKGLIPRLIETDFGYHIIRVDELKTNLAFKIATIKREITPSDETLDVAFRKADYFAGTSNNYQEFKNNAEKDSLLILSANKIKKNDRSINNLNNARQVVRWLYNDAERGEVSPVFEVGNNYVVAVMTDEVEEGTAELEDVRYEVLQKVKNERKAKLIREKLSSLSGSLEEIADSYGEDAEVFTKSDLKLQDNSIRGVGIVPKMVGVAFALDEGERSAPIEEENGIVIVKLESLTEAPEIADYTSYRQNARQERAGRLSFKVAEAVKEKAEIEDKRYKFF